MLESVDRVDFCLVWRSSNKGRERAENMSGVLHACQSGGQVRLVPDLLESVDLVDFCPVWRLDPQRLLNHPPSR